MPPGNRAQPSSDWPLYFIENLDKSEFKKLNGFLSMDKNRAGNETFVFKRSNYVALIEGPGNQVTNLYACTLWTAQISNSTGSGYCLRKGYAPGWGPEHPTYGYFLKLSAVKKNSYKVITLTEYNKLKERKNLGNQPATVANAALPDVNAATGANAADAAYYSSFGAAGAAIYVNNSKKGGGGGGGGPGRGGTGGNNDTQTSTAYELDSAVSLVVRMPVGYAGVAKSPSRNPGFIQTWREEDGKTYTEEFLFRYIPQNVKYDGLSSEWIEIPRAENMPFVDWARWPLMKVSMSFLIASDRIEPGGETVPDGMSTAVEPQIQKLRQMAQRKVPITFINMDELLTVQLRRGKELGRGLEFVINDMSVSATRRVTNFTNGSASIPSGISVAQVEMTFTEIPVERTSLVYLQQIMTPDVPPPGKDVPNNGIPKEYTPEEKATSGGPNRIDTVFTDDAATS